MLTLSSDLSAVIFDLHGTIVRDSECHIKAYEAVFAEFNIKLTSEEYEEKVVNHSDRHIWPVVLGREVSEVEVKKLSEQRKRYYTALLEKGGVVTPGIIELLDQLDLRGITKALSTSAPPDVVDTVLHMAGISDRFDIKVTGVDVSRGKPDPEIYITTLDRLECFAEEVWAFEDSPHGVRAARAAGIEVTGVLPEYTQPELEAAGATTFITDFTEVVVE